ncbi:agmatinase [Marinobacterium jannaschii]|uniref:agmatinase n=1 Tax=Marinobacterium jannaschii TaxID=64970 RepID=UPI0004866732|nr:agmatinase [Marinobacterium jannaschii]
MSDKPTRKALIADADSAIYTTMGMTYMDFPPVSDLNASDAEVIVSGVPFDLATSGRSGARFGPQGVRQASNQLIWEGARWPWPFALDDHLSVADSGNLFFKHGEPQTLVENLEAHISNILEAGKSALTFGGDHFITLPVLRAYAKKHGPVAVIHFDAHTDTYSGGTKYDHGTLFHHAVTEGLIDTERSLQIGIRTTYDYDNHPFEVLDAAWVNKYGPEAVLEKIHSRVGDHKAYVSFDIDGLDPAFAPGTGTPVAAGISIDCALKVIRGMQGLNLVGMDVVEVAPAYDHAEITALAGATLALEYLYVLAANKGAE